MTTVGDVGAGHSLGRYELLIPIASGGMASVWSARVMGARGFQKVVAIKVMLADLADDVDFEKMFLDEAQTASRIKHPNVVEIVDLGEENGVLYQVMEWVDGEPLNLLVRDPRARAGLPVPLVLRIGSDACAGLHCAHELTGDDGKLVGLVHRNVTPSNVMASYDGEVKVVDFGIAKATTNAQQTRVGQMKGKPPYMSPEQARGEAVNRRADVFALGIVLYQLATGKHPFRGDNDFATLRSICDARPARLASELTPAVPPELDAVIAKALSKKRDDRFESMARMAAALDAVLPPDKRASTGDLGAYMREILGERGEKRRVAIREAVRIADERASERVDPAPEPEAPTFAAPAKPAPPPEPAPPPVDVLPPERPAPPSTEDLERYVTRPPSDNRSVIGALVFACVLAAALFALLSSR